MDDDGVSNAMYVVEKASDSSQKAPAGQGPVVKSLGVSGLLVAIPVITIRTIVRSPSWAMRMTRQMRLLIAKTKSSFH